MAHGRVYAFRTIDSYLSQKVWSCLSDATPNASKRFDFYATNNNLTAPVRDYWSEREIETFKEKLKEVFRIDVDIEKKDKMCHIINKVRRKI